MENNMINRKSSPKFELQLSLTNVTQLEVTFKLSQYFWLISFQVSVSYHQHFNINTETNTYGKCKNLLDTHCLKGLWTVSSCNICHKGFIWHILAPSSPSLIYHSFAAKLPVQMVGINEALLDKFRPWLIPVTNRDRAGSAPLIPSSSPQTPKIPAGWFEESAKQLHNTVDYKMKKWNWIAWCKLTI